MQLCSLDTSGMQRARVYVHARVCILYQLQQRSHEVEFARRAGAVRRGEARRPSVSRRPVGTACRDTRGENGRGKHPFARSSLKIEKGKIRRVRARERKKARSHGTTIRARARARDSEARELCARQLIQDVLEVAHFLCTTLHRR